MPESVLASLREVLLGGWVGEGPRVREFELALAPWMGTPNVLALSSGTAALQLAMLLAGVGPGDEVITTPLTCVATNHAILHAGARVVWSDVDPATGNVDPADVRRKITGRTRAIVLVHWGGDPCDIAAIEALARPRGIKVIEDAGHAFGARYDGAPIGSHSDLVCFSFQSVKVLTTVDGGALCCRDPRLRERGRLLRWYGLDRDERRRKGIDDDGSDIVEAGFKYHMNDVTAAIGVEQLRHVAVNLRRAQENARVYDAAFDGLGSVRPLARDSRREGSSWLYTLLVDQLAAFRIHMEGHGVEVSKVHVRNDRYTVFRPFAAPLPGLDRFTRDQICIPVGWWLSPQDRQTVIDAVRSFDAAQTTPSLRLAGGTA